MVYCCGCFWLTVSLTDSCIAPLLQKGQLVPTLLNCGVGAGSAWNKAGSGAFMQGLSCPL